MGFCRRCGDIVSGPRCKCGGSAVAPVVNWTGSDDGSKQDRWSKTYITQDKSANDVAPVQPSDTGTSTSSRRFPRPAGTGTGVSASVSSRVSAHIASTTASRPSSPLKPSRTGLSAQSDEHNAKEGILPSPHTSELAKVWGSVLQPKETLDSFTCALCSTPFPPDATIYPDPSYVTSAGVDTSSGQNSTRFLCRPCFTVNGGSRGDCHDCHRAVLILKSEGGFVENSGRVWHKKCFKCDGCGMKIGDKPMVDLLGRPSCAECFDTCLKRPSRDDTVGSPKRKGDVGVSHLGGNRKDRKTEREGSPALEELEARLGIQRNVQSSASSSASPIGRLPKNSATTPTKEPSKSWQSSSRTERSRAESLSSRNVASSSSPSTSYRQHSNSIGEYSSHGTDTASPGRTAYRRQTTPYGEDQSGGGGSGRLMSPRTSLGQAERPTEEAVEEMKRRFLSGNGSPAVTPQKSSASNTSTPRRKRSKSRSRSRPRVSVGAEGLTSNAANGNPKDIRASAANSPARTLRSSVSTSSLRVRSHRTGETETSIGMDTDLGLDSEREAYRILPDRTGESTQPLRIRPNNTGGTVSAVSRDMTGSTSFLSEDATGNTVYMTANDTGGTFREDRAERRAGDRTIRSVKAQRTGDYMSEHETAGYIKKQRTGDGVRRQHTGERYVRGQHTGDTEVTRHDTGATDYSEVRRHRTGEEENPKRNAPEPRRTDYLLRRDRTGDAEVESLLGPIVPMASADLIDLSPSPSGSLSRIPMRAGTRTSGRLSGGDYRSSLELGFRPSSTSGSSVASSGYESSVSSIPDLASDFSDTTSTRSGGPSTPPSVSPPSRSNGKSANGPSRYPSDARNKTPTPRSRSKTISHSLGASSLDLQKEEKCEKCRQPLFSVKHGGKFVTVPEEPTSTGAAPRRYHTACFRCTVCGEVFEEKEGGHAVFVRVEEGACHVHCAPPEKITLRKSPPSAIPKASRIPLASVSSGNTAVSSPPGSLSSGSRTAYYASSSRYEPPPSSSPPSRPSASVSASSPAQPRFGRSPACPGCHKAVSPMERGVVPGPQGSKWHAGCLICGGLEAKGKRREQGKAGCGKKLDSGAKTDAEGGVWCRECMLLLPTHLRNASPVRSPIAQVSTGSRPLSMVLPQSTGTTLARQFTGIGGGSTANDNDLLRQLTGGGLSPTRQLSSSPTKMHDGPRPSAARYPRPKSVIGTRSTGSEGRGMFLVRQLTGGNKSFSGNEFGI